MRNRIKRLGERDREFLPLWMRSIQESGSYELGYIKALPLCYALPGRADDIMARIKAKTDYASRGDYSPSVSYQIDDSVKYNGEYYTCIRSSFGNTPADDGEFWIKNFSFKFLDFEADRYIIDILDGEIQDKYLAFPQRGEKLP